MSMWQSFVSAVKSAVGIPAASAESSGTTTAADAATASSSSSAQTSAASGADEEHFANINIEEVLAKLADQRGGGGNWRTSIVDLLKLLGLDSSLMARKQLADELDVHVAADGSAEQNIALHHAVMQKVEQNGGTVPDSLKN